MVKKVLIISTSLRGGSNSDILANECAKGAKEAGHELAQFLTQACRFLPAVIELSP